MTDNEREQRYAEAMYAADVARLPNDPYPFEVERWDVEARAVMAVADAEQSELRAEIDEWRNAHKRTSERSGEYLARAEAAERALADERAKQIIEQRTECEKCTMQFGGFHKGCDGNWVRMRRTVTPWEPVAPLTIRGFEPPATALAGPEPEVTDG